ncbi:hypothetical protein QWZ06_10310 [Chryseobacterium tructae]|nr:hypothetical protein [Chryseobacterium tructae]MDN3692642.1 hypothetical protein [Chryseobacterium tructae]
MKNLFLSICTAAVLASCGSMTSPSASKVGKLSQLLPIQNGL